MSNDIVVLQERKRLFRSRKNAIIGGVCSGIANYASVDPTVVRLAFVVSAVFNMWILLAYVVLMFVVPSEDDCATGTPWAEDLVETIKTDYAALKGYVSLRDREGWRAYWRQIRERFQRRWNEVKSWT